MHRRRSATRRKTNASTLFCAMLRRLGNRTPAGMAVSCAKALVQIGIYQARSSLRAWPGTILRFFLDRAQFCRANTIVRSAKERYRLVDDSPDVSFQDSQAGCPVVHPDLGTFFNAERPYFRGASASFFEAVHQLLQR